MRQVVVISEQVEAFARGAKCAGEVGGDEGAEDGAEGVEGGGWGFRADCGGQVGIVVGEFGGELIVRFGEGGVAF